MRRTASPSCLRGNTGLISTFCSFAHHLAPLSTLRHVWYGTKIEANAALEANHTLTSIEKEVRTVLDEAERVDAAEDALYGVARRGDELPPELADPNTRLERLRQAKQRLNAQQAAREAKHEEHVQQRAEAEGRKAHKLRGRKPKPPEPHGDARANITDPASRIMKTRRGYVQGYNAQAVATCDQVIVAAEVTDEANDVHQFVPMVEAMDRTLKVAGMHEPRVRSSRRIRHNG
jgi:hypothetical protein